MNFHMIFYVLETIAKTLGLSCWLKLLLNNNRINSEIVDLSRFRTLGLHMVLDLKAIIHIDHCKKLTFLKSYLLMFISDKINLSCLYIIEEFFQSASFLIFYPHDNTASAKSAKRIDI